jgi:hypothetical protein
MLSFLDQLFFVVHTLLIGFNMVGWAWRRTRTLHLVTFGLTAFSWFALGAFYGWGYCLCTDWHFQIRRQLGYVDPESSYVQLLVRKLCGASLSRPSADFLAVGIFVAILIATTVVWIRDWQVHRQTCAPKFQSSQSSDSVS